ncbi:APC family permease [Tahibacter amnicola]|uniref:Amino acid permease n=1 Tax=Tahibacter amnicola TaxID=2976241 RepID=A0ABY6BB49_9GAMM|nr:amino acid permease [Tahibacter amnicola]UXI67283.1 amino acid permease [Tahibacter amnicola]
MSQAQNVGYARRLGVLDATMVVVGGIIGSGIFLNPSIVAQRTPGSGTTLLVWALGGLFALAGAFIYAELGARRPQAGGGYVYLREAYSPLVAFLFGWIMLLVNYSGSIAAVATTFAAYACRMAGLGAAWTKPVAVSAIVLLAGINYFGIRAGAIVQNILTLLKLLAVAAVVAAGLFFAGGAPPEAVIAPAAPMSLGSALLPVLFAYSGWFYINNIAGEIREPQRNIPRALVFGMIVCTGCYLLANYAYLHVLGHAGLAASTAPAAELMRRAFGPGGETVISAGIAISTFGFCNIAILGGARVFQVMGADGVFFRAVARIEPRYRSPDVALFILAGWAAVLAYVGGYGQLLDFSTVGDWIGSAMVAAALFYYRRHEGSEPVFRSPLYPFLPLFFIGAVAFVVISSAIAKPWETLVGLGLIAAGVPVYFAWQRFGNRDGATPGSTG